MSAIEITTDDDSLTLTTTARYQVSPERAWHLWSDPRQLERWWGPPGYPATVEVHDFAAGGRVTYFMTSPEGERFPGYWDVLEADAPRRVVMRHGFSDSAGTPDAGRPRMLMSTTIEAEAGGGCAVTTVRQFDSADEMAELRQMGIEEGTRLAMGQIPAILSA